MVTKVDFYGGAHVHYVNHLLPIWKAVPEEIRGRFVTRRNTGAERRATELGILPTRFQQNIFNKRSRVAVASYEDYRVCAPAQVIYLNHGVGQTYRGDARGAKLASYTGGPGRERVILFLCPSQRVVELNREAYPDVPSVAIGVPYLDPFFGRARPPTGVVAISFHANISAQPETRWTFPYFQKAVIALARSSEFDILGHGHPRIAAQMKAFWGKLGVRYEPDWWKVLEQASVYCIDNSSSGPEAAACGIPLVWMSSPHYRRDVHHGQRFWDWTREQVHVEKPEDLAEGIRLAMMDPITHRIGRQRMLDDAYSGLLDGKATQRAVEALVDLSL